MIPLVAGFAVGALVAARTGRPDEAGRAASSAVLLLTRLGDLCPRTALLGYLLLAQSAVALDDRAAARDLVEEAERVRRLEATATLLNDQLDELRGQLTTGDLYRLGGFPSLTRAELRVLPYLTTHLSLQDIARSADRQPQHGQEPLWRSTASSGSPPATRP